MTALRTRIPAALAFALAFACARVGFAADALRWDIQRNRIDAAIETWTVPQVLQRVATASGWQIFIDPRITNSVATKFQNREPGEALPRLLGDLNFALVPETNALPRLYVFRNSRKDATQSVLPIQAKASGTNMNKSLIKNELIVRLKPGEKIEDLAKKLGAKIVGRSDELNAYRLRFDDADSAQLARESLESDPSVASVDNNYYVARPEEADALGLSASGASRLIPKAAPDGKYVVVGLIDSAVQPKQGNLSAFMLPGVSVAGETKPPEDDPTHGTSMAETILRSISLAQGETASTTVRILPVDVYGNNPSTSTYDVALGVYKAVSGGAMIVNLSLGSDGDSSFLRDTIKGAHDQGVVFLAAAGNSPVTTPTFPAAYPEVIGVTAGDRQGNIAPYANRGDFVKAIAPGTSYIVFEGEQYRVVGTSASTAYASGLAASVAESLKKYGSDVESVVTKALAPKTK